MDSDHIHPPLPPSQLFLLVPFMSSSQLHAPILLLLLTLSPISPVYICPWVWVQPLGYGNLPAATFPKESSSPSVPLQPTANGPSPICVVILTGLILCGSCASGHAWLAVSWCVQQPHTPYPDVVISLAPPSVSTSALPTPLLLSQPLPGWFNTGERAFTVTHAWHSGQIEVSASAATSF